MNNEIMVSISCLAYNHAKYIRQCLDGFIMQQTNFKFEVLIHDDASTDGTQDIIIEYEKKYPDIIKPIYQTENQHSKGVKISFTYQYPRAKGKYIALCEGDDYWTDPLKLQKQFDAMERNPDCTICAHKVNTITESGILLNITYPCNNKETGKIESSQFTSEIFSQTQNIFQTSSYFLKKSIIDEYYQNQPEFAKTVKTAGDKSILLFCASKGNAYYINVEMSHYRRMGISSWSKIMDSNKILYAEHIKSKILSAKQYDAFTNYKFTEIIHKKYLTMEELNLANYSGNYKRLLKKENRYVLQNIPLKHKIYCIAKALFNINQRITQNDRN